MPRSDNYGKLQGRVMALFTSPDVRLQSSDIGAALGISNKHASNILGSLLERKAIIRVGAVQVLTGNLRSKAYAYSIAPHGYGEDEKWGRQQTGHIQALIITRRRLVHDTVETAFSAHRKLQKILDCRSVTQS